MVSLFVYWLPAYKEFKATFVALKKNRVDAGFLGGLIFLNSSEMTAVMLSKVLGRFMICHPL